MLRLPSQPTPTEWQSNWTQIQPALRKVRRSMASLRTSSLKVMRVSQLDSDILDIELFDILKEQLWSGLSLFKVTRRNKCCLLACTYYYDSFISLPLKSRSSQSYWAYSILFYLSFLCMIPQQHMDPNFKT
jgi:hypothetical protein